MSSQEMLRAARCRVQLGSRTDQVEVEHDRRNEFWCSSNDKQIQSKSVYIEEVEPLWVVSRPHHKNQYRLKVPTSNEDNALR